MTEIHIDKLKEWPIYTWKDRLIDKYKEILFFFLEIHCSGLDIVSGGELFRAKIVNYPSKKIVYASVGKTDDEIAAGIKVGILFFCKP